MRLFLDTSALVAMEDLDDANHKRAMEFREKIRSGDTIFRSLMTSNYVVDETLTRLKKKVSARAAFLFYEALQRKMKENNLTLLLINQETFNKAYKIFKNNPIPKSFSFTDAGIVALMKAHKIKTVLTFDEDFKKIKPKIQVFS